MREAIDSALAQTYENVEIIVVNDGSADDTDEIAMSYGNQIRYFKKENGGVSSALNLGIKEMRGEYFSWLSHDDRYTPNKIEAQISAVSACEEEDLICYCNSAQIDKDNNVIKHSKKNKFLNSGINPWNRALLALIRSSCFSGCALLIPKRAFIDAGFFDEQLKFAQDFLMWMRVLLKEYNVLYVQDECVQSRIHSKQGTQTAKDVFIKDSSIFGKLMFNPLELVSSRRENYIYYMTLYFAKNNCTEALELYRKKGKFSLLQRFRITMLSSYGKIRPTIRKMYYRIFRHIKTK